MDSLAIQNEIKVEKSAPGAMRAAAEDPDEARHSNKRLAKFKGGELTVGEFMRWIGALPPQYATQLRQADDTMLIRFAKVLSQNVLLLSQADSAKIRVTPAEWKTMADGYRNQIDTLRAEMGLDTASLWDSTVANRDRSKVAAMKVDQYFDRLVNGKSRLRPLPSTLATVLRDRSSYKVYEAGVNRAVEVAQASRGKSDSARAKSGPLQPAPGPAPIPGASPQTGDTGRAQQGRPQLRPPADTARVPGSDSARRPGR
jgi:hypothetical protein